MGARDTTVASPAMRMAALLSRAERARRLVEHRQTLGTAYLRLLWLLGDGQPRTMREVAEQLGLEQSTVNRQVAGARRHGYLRRTRPQGSAAAVLEVTEAGLEVLDRDVTTAMGAIGTGLGALTPEEERELLALLGRFFDSYEQELG
ncbi:MarR family winged helix-turn-helix transcriptional regulator [Demequina silvatica]|uniref:MarR family winged helix-turn-helix transcriptional regulator n=1 Tax=Demequina silvatica TaxID=1638988 RepID=UPI0007843DB4|nr:helix-turn-helix domain-containing protein [Demequina silvatica]